MKKIAITILTFLLLAGTASAAYKLPEPMVGQTEVTVGIGSTARTYYGATTGNETVLNYSQSGQTPGKNYAPSLQFDGVDDHIQIPDSSDFNFSSSGSGKYSVSVWVKPTADYVDSVTGKFGPIISQWGGSSAWALYNNKGILYLYNHNGTAPSSWGNSSRRLAPDQWQMVTAVYSGGTTGTNAYLYLNGQPLGSGGTLNVIPQDSTNSWLGIGKAFAGADLFKGKMDEVRIYNRALNSTEVSDLYQGNSVTTGMVGHWDFNEGTGTVANDRSSSGNNDGTLANGPTWNASDGPQTQTAAPADDLFGFDQEMLLNCVNGIVIGNTTSRCFVKNSVNAGSIDIMNSRTYYNGTPSLEVAALYYPSKTVMGDVYGALNDFAFWGRNLHQQNTGTPTSDATWKTGDYGPINEKAQASWYKANGTTETDQLKSYKSKIDTMLGEATSFAGDGGTGSVWYLQGSGGVGDNSNGDKNKYPEGKIWKTGNLTPGANSSRTYCGKGTVIVDGVLALGSSAGGASFQPSTLPGCEDSRLGFIVTANVTVYGNSNIQAAIFDYDSFYLGSNNVTLTGSFVAKSFSGMTGDNIRFYYDYGLDSAWPPGFRYLNMPHAGETSQ